MNMKQNKCRVCNHELSPPIVSNIRDYEYGTPGEWTYQPCDNCGIVQLMPFPELDLLISAYPPEYSANNDTKKQNRLTKYLSTLVIKNQLRPVHHAIKNASAIFDVGCGSGNLLSYIKETYPGKHLAGVDFSESAVQACKAKGMQVHKGLFVNCNPEERFDFIFMNNYLEHTLNPAQELSHAFNLLVPGGQICGLLPNFDSADRTLFGRFWGGNHCPRHTFQFGPRSLENYLRKAGFKDIKIVNELHAAHISISINNMIFALKEKLSGSSGDNKDFKRIPFFAIITLALSPFSLLLAMFRKNGALHFTARKC